MKPPLARRNRVEMKHVPIPSSATIIERSTVPGSATRRQPLAAVKPRSLNEQQRLISQRPRPITSNPQMELVLSETGMTPGLHRRVAARLPFWTGDGNLGGGTQTSQALPLTRCHYHQMPLRHRSLLIILYHLLLTIALKEEVSFLMTRLL